MNVTKCTELAWFFRSLDQINLAEEYERIACKKDMSPYKELIQDGLAHMKSISVHKCKECTMTMSDQGEISQTRCLPCRARTLEERMSEIGMKMDDIVLYPMCYGSEKEMQEAYEPLAVEYNQLLLEYLDLDIHPF